MLLSTRPAFLPCRHPARAKGMHPHTVPLRYRRGPDRCSMAPHCTVPYRTRCSTAGRRSARALRQQQQRLGLGSGIARLLYLRPRGGGERER